MCAVMALELTPVPYPAETPAATPWADEAIGELQCEQMILTGALIWECFEEIGQACYRFSLIHLLTSLQGLPLLKVDYLRRCVPIYAHYDSSTHSSSQIKQILDKLGSFFDISLVIVRAYSLFFIDVNYLF